MPNSVEVIASALLVAACVLPAAARAAVQDAGEEGAAVAGRPAPPPLGAQDAAGGAGYAPDVLAASDEPMIALADLEPGDGLEVRLWAAEPMLANPVCLAIDEQGAVYVGETFRHTDGVLDIRNHTDFLADDFACETVAERVRLMRRILGERFEAMDDEHERVRLLRDTDGDDVADVATVFADGFSQPAAGIGAGLLARDGRVVYACVPELWALRDTDGDDVADERTVLSEGYGVRIGYLGHDLHGPVLGPDGRLWFSIGDRGLHVETADGTLHLPDTGAVLRCEPDGSGLELVHTGLRNPQELAFNDFGDLFTGDNNADNGDRARIVQVVPGGDSGWRGPYQWVQPRAGLWNSEQRWHLWHPEQPAFLVPPVAHLTAGPSGFAHEPGTALTAEWSDHFFLCDFQGTVGGSGIYAFELAPEGAGFTMGEPERALWNLLATDCDFGPDGALYVSDWVESWNKTGRGRVWRVSAKTAAPAGAAGTTPTARASSGVPVAKASTAGPGTDRARAALASETAALLAGGMADREASTLAELLDHADARVRLAAQLELTTRGAKGLAALSLVARADADRPAGATKAAVLDRRDLPTLHALWGLGVLARRDPSRRDAAVDVLLAVAQDRSGEPRAQALEVLGDLREPSAAGVVLAGLADPAPRVRFRAALAAGRLELDQAVDGLVQLVRETGDSDPMLRHAAVTGLLGCVGTGRLDELARDDDRHVRLAALLVMRRQASAGLARFLDDSDPRLVHEAARAIHDVPVAAALPVLADHLLDDGWHRRFGTDVAPAVDEDGEALELDHALIWRRAMNTAYRIGTPERGRELARFARREHIDGDLRAEAVDLLAAWAEPEPLDRITGFHRPLPPRDAGFVLDLAVELGEVTERETPDEVLTAWARLAHRLAEGDDTAEARRVLKTLPPELMGRLAGIVTTEEFGVDARVAALEALQFMQPPDLEQLVIFALESKAPDLRAAALGALQSLSLAEAMPRLPDLLEAGELPEQRVALRILREANDPRADEWIADELRDLVAGAYPAELVLDLVLAGEAREKSDVDLLLRRHHDKVKADPGVAPWLDGLFGGDATAGREVFERTQMQCVRCHVSAEGAEAVGPDLTGVGERLARLQLLESILDPNKRIAPGYGTTKLVLDDGTAVSGRVLGDVDDAGAELRVLDADGHVTTVEAARVVERRPGISAMPEGLAAGLTREEMRDLIEYVAGL